MVPVQILIPVRGNDGAEFLPDLHAQFEATLRETFGGWQCLPGLVSGEWVAGGVVYPDRLRRYVVSVAGMVADAAKVAEVVAIAKALYGQHAIYVSYLGVNEIV